MGILDVARKSFARLKAGQNGHAKPPYMAPAVAKACAATLRKYDKNDINDKRGGGATAAVAAPPSLKPGYDKNDINDQRSAFRLVTDPADLAAVVNAVEESTIIGVDTETTGLDPRKDRVRLLSLNTDTEGGRFTYLLDLFALDRALLPPLWEALASRPLVMHNAAFDLSMLGAIGFTPGVVHDVFLLAKLLAAGTFDKCSLKALAEKYLNRTLDKESQKSNWAGDLTAEQLRYAAADVEVLPPLYEKLVENIKAAKLERVAEIERRALPAVVWTATSGVLFDREAWDALADGAKAEAERFAEQLNAAAPRRPDSLDYDVWNWNSPEQVKEAFALIGVTLEKTDDEALAGVDHPLAALLRKYREASKRSCTYGRDWTKHVADDGRVYSDWRQIGAASGRMASLDPNLQNLPRDVAYRKCFKAPPGRVLVKADYSQIELRIAAKLSGDKALLEAYRRGEDLHTLTARLVLGKETVTKEDRQLAKALNFGLLYGMGAKRFRDYAANDYGVEMTLEQAQEMRAAFFRAYPGLAKWHRKAGASGKNAVETRTLAGRRRLNVQRFTEKLNTPDQGTGADGLKMVLALLWERRHEVPGAFPVLIVHDEIVIECDEGQGPKVADWLRRCMAGGMRPLIDPVPVEVETRVGPTWGG
jgi:DNA polymerase-1